MDDKKIVIKINKQGEIRADVHGIKGPMCVSEIQKLLENVAETYETHKTDEYYMSPTVTQKNINKEKMKVRK